MLGVLPQDEDKVPADDDNQNPPFDFFGLGLSRPVLAPS
jgi:hypothetical protein